MKGVTMLLVLSQASFVKTGSHSLWAFSTLIYGETQFPEFSVVVMVDDVQVLFYDSNVGSVVSRSQTNSTDGADKAIHTGCNFAASHIQNSMKRRSQHIKLQSNHTEGVHVYQRMAGCVLDNDKESKIMEWDAYDGMEAMSYNMQNSTFNSLWPELVWNLRKEEVVLVRFKTLYQPICIQTLKHYLRKDKNIVLRREHPRVRLLHNTHTDTGEVKVRCLATGF
ncbi:hypothetical protein AGOR_G00138990 [Albula goreensis]|uniref:MHC class I-like antigen recognition-like domain-containing protein n=1 Tax=Albula goreensis TaxID=1534307 RepID=A0A8T3D8A6_9TELE|nr:hypothetical protein AGOR_G00138990 [Albula goreensis]